MLITEAIERFLAADPQVAGMIPGGIHLDLRPEKGSWPYLVLSQPTNPVTEFGHGPVYISDPEVIVKVYTEGSYGPTAAARIIETIHAKLLTSRLIPMDATATVTMFLPLQNPIVAREVPDRAPDAGWAYAGSARYRATVEWTLPA